MKTILIMAGGTGGHIFPGLAVAEQMRAAGWDVVWMGARGGMEERLVPKHGYRAAWIRAKAARGKGIVQKLLLPANLLYSFWESARHIRRLRPDVVLGLGGYVAFPGGMMASLWNRPLALHEQNAILGRANRLLAPRADALALSYANTGRVPAGTATHVVGNPVRPALAALAGGDYPGTDGALRLLVLGGSLGARIFADVVPAAIAGLPAELRQRLVVAQHCRIEDLDRVRDAYDQANVPAELSPFFPDVAGRLATAHLVIARAGAGTVAELACAGRPSFLVPLPQAIDDHQAANARAIAAAGAAIVMPQPGFTAAALTAQLTTQLNDPGALAQAAAAAARLAQPDAAKRLADLVLSLVRARSVPRPAQEKV